MNTNVQQAGANEYFLTLDDVQSINHLVVFLTGQVPFSDGYGGSIYFGWPTEVGGVSWQLLGFINNTKPSAIFKITKAWIYMSSVSFVNIVVLSHSLQVKPSEMVTPFGQTTLASFASPSQTAALIGVQVEPLAEMVLKTPASGTQASTVETMTEFSQKMVENLFNFASSFAVDPRASMLTSGELYIPSSALRQWYTTFQRRLAANPHFWKAL